MKKEHAIIVKNMINGSKRDFILVQREERLEEILEKIKKSGEGKKYDSLIGLSSGTDSSYAAYLAKKFGLRPLAIHLDNGWNSELAAKNIENIIRKLNLDLYTYVINWEELNLGL